MSKTHKPALASATPTTAQAAPQHDPDLQNTMGNAAAQDLIQILDPDVDDQLAEPSTRKQADAIRKAACLATNRMFEHDIDAFATEHGSLLEHISSMQTQYARMEDRDAVIDKTATEDPRYGLVVANRVTRVADYYHAFSGVYGLGGWLMPTHYGPDGERPLIGHYNREGTSPETTPDSVGISVWLAWAIAQGAELNLLMSRAKEVEAWASAHYDDIWTGYESGPIGQMVAAAQNPAPSVLTDAKGREFMYLLEVAKDQLPDSFVEKYYGRDKGELRIEQQALDFGVSVDRLAPLQSLVDSLTDQRNLDADMQTLRSLPDAEKEFVIRHLRWDTGTEERLLGDRNTSAYTRLSAALADQDENTALFGDPAEATAQQGLRDVVAATSIGGYATDGEDTQDLYNYDNMAMDMARGVPGSILNVSYGMVRSVPIAGDLLDGVIGDHVDDGIGWVNEEWMGLDHDSAQTQEVWGQTAGIVAGTIGFAGIGGPAGGATSVAGKSIQIPTWLARSVWMGDIGQGLYNGVVGEDLQGNELEGWQRALALIGVGLNASQGAAARAQTKAANTAPPADVQAKILQKEGALAGQALHPDGKLDLVSEQIVKSGQAAEESWAKSIEEAIAALERWKGRAASTGAANAGTRATIEGATGEEDG